ncbi:MAG: flagellar biosynthesis protein FlgD [Acidobacteriia bacterium]|nr:flagellar biosynthesis protein FlgD [Terriglobia bacterium]MBV8904099.1 flagellar biosynthesis protein FlgD [Terriglobia bacterium]
MSPSPSITSSTPASSAAAPSNSSSSTSSSAKVNEDTFMQLLVAELQNQDPSNPADGTQFVTQLAEFQQLTTSMNMATSVSGIQSDTDKLVGIASGTAASSAATSASGTPASNANTSSTGTSGTQS